MRFIFETIVTPKSVRLLVVSIVAILKKIIKEDVIYDLELALTEACTNVLTHAYPQEERNKKIKFILEIIFQDRLIFKVIDWGIEFKPSKSLPHDSSTSGRGIYIIRKIMNDFIYKRVGDRNEVIMVKKLEENLWKKF
ncbi:MAG: serine/threonine-protein kinase RsbW [Desulfonauticus sp.]|nr:serine/threonine-protein kinase RsbW [Desulfonauticus sp.]